MHAGTVKRAVSNPISEYIPSNDTEMSSQLYMESDVSQLQQIFQIMSLHYANETRLPSHGHRPRRHAFDPLLFMVVSVFVLALLGVTSVIVKLMQKHCRGYLYRHG